LAVLLVGESILWGCCVKTNLRFLKFPVKKFVAAFFKPITCLKIFLSSTNILPFKKILVLPTKIPSLQQKTAKQTKIPSLQTCFISCLFFLPRVKFPPAYMFYFMLVFFFPG
jgi:hypothetical protein